MSDRSTLVSELTPVPGVMDCLERVWALPGVLLLESARRQEAAGRYTFLTADPQSVITRRDCAFGENPFAEFRALRDATAFEDVPGLPPFQGGFAGLLSYDLAGAFERLPRLGDDEFGLPDLAVGLYDWVIAWDHTENRCWIISQGIPETDPARRSARAHERMQFVQGLLNKDSVWRSHPATENRVQLAGAQHAAPGLPGLKSNFRREEYLRAVERTVEYIRAGDIFQANLSQRLVHPLQVPALELYRRLRECNPAPFAGLFAYDDWAVLSASPERFLRVDGDLVQTRPIKGTRGRFAGPEADLFSRDELRESDKDRAENVMIVDLLRNDLSRVCQPGSLEVSQLCAVETYETVQHLVSQVGGRLAPEFDVWDLLTVTFPGGSITGAPKIRAMEIIAELEPHVRGAYCGSLFYVSGSGQMDSSILIRTFTCRSGWVQCPVGGGIVAQSDPVAEYEETLHKAEGMVRALRG